MANCKHMKKGRLVYFALQGSIVWTTSINSIPHKDLVANRIKTLVLKIGNLQMLNLCIYIFETNNLHNCLNIFVKTSKISTQRTTSSWPSSNLSLYIPRFETARLQRSIKYKARNTIPKDIQTETQRLFKTQLKTFWVTTVITQCHHNLWLLVA